MSKVTIKEMIDLIDADIDLALEVGDKAVSYTHLTLPTIYSV